MRRRRLIRISRSKMEAFIQSHFETQSHFLEVAAISRTTLYRMLSNDAVQQSTVSEMISSLSANGIQLTATELLDDEQIKSSAEELASAWQQDEWEVIPSSLKPPAPMSNGLVMQTAKVRHRLIDGEFGRAKVYDIRGLSREMRLRYRDVLTRHAAVCRKLFDCPQISTNITMVAQCDFQLWTIVDRWVEGSTLSELVTRSPLSTKVALQLLEQVARGMNALHCFGIVGREIHPGTIIVSDDRSRCTITDLELAKLLDTETTVSAEWVPNPFRAPEIQGRICHPQADLYSLAKITVFMLTGKTHKFPDDGEVLRSSALSTSVADYLAKSLSPRWKQRPESVAQLLSHLSVE